ncbi:hypothetical protein HDU90_001307 [Geranomyces variabilis]|nr:hypothetical protein HDU90_001307 [Geranomyces variabilis]
MLGWYESLLQNKWVYTHPIVLSLGQISYEAAACIRASVFLQKPNARMVGALTVAACLVHSVVPWSIVGYSLANGRDQFEVHQRSFSNAAVADVTFAVFVEAITNLTFIYQLAHRMGMDRYVFGLHKDSGRTFFLKAGIFTKLAKSPGVFRLFTNIALAIATLCQVADPNFSTNPKFGGMFSLWTGWQINTFVVRPTE